MPKPKSKKEDESKVPTGFDLPTVPDDDLVAGTLDDFTDSLYYPTDDPERKEEEAAEAAVKAASYPIIPEISAWFEEQIDASSRNANIKVEEIEVGGVKFSRTISIEGQLLAYQLLETLLREKHAEFSELAQELGNE